MKLRIIVGLVSVALSLSAFADVFNVPADYPTLAAAVAAATGEGDEIVLAKGVYTNTAICTISHAITVRGATGNRDDVTLYFSGVQGFALTAAGVTLRDLTVKGCKNSNYGIAVKASAKNCTIANCRFTACTATGGNSDNGVVWSSVGGMTMEDCLIDGLTTDLSSNTLGAYGSYRYGKIAAAIYLSGGGGVIASTISRCVISNCLQVGVYDRNGVLALSIGSYGTTVKDCEIVDNEVQFIAPFTTDRPFLVFSTRSNTTFSGCTVHDNHYWGVGEASTHVVACSIASGTSGVNEYDNGYKFTNAGTSQILNVPADYATLEAAYAAAEPFDEIVLATGTYTLANVLDVKKPVTIRSASGDRDDVTISGNGGKYWIRLWTDEATLKDLTVTGCAVGAWYCMKSPIALFGGGLVQNCRVKGESASDSVFGIRNYNGTVRRSQVDGCSGREYYANNGTNGNAAYWQAGSLALGDGCILSGNTITDVQQASNYLSCPGAFITGGTFRNAIISGCSCTYKSTVTSPTTIAANQKALGLYVTAGEVENCTVIDNYYTSGVAQDNVGGVTCVGGTVKNTIIWGNGSRDGVTVANLSGSKAANATVCASDAATVAEMEGGLALTAAPYEWQDGKLVVGQSSPVVDQGVTADWMASATDVYGTTRVLGGAVDIGAYEYDPTLRVTWSATKYAAYEEYEEIVAPATTMGDLTGLAYSWDLDGDGVFEHAGAGAKIALKGAGTTVVSLKATNDAGDSCVVSHTFTIRPTEARYVVKGNADAAFPYTTLATAAATVGEALATATNGVHVYVASATYPLTATLYLTNAVIVSSLTGNRDDVILDAQAKCRVVRITNADATLAGVTLKNGRTAADSSPGVYNGGGTIDNCRVTQCEWYENGGGGSQPRGAIHNAGIVRNTLVDSNYGGGMYRNDNQPESSGVYQAAGLMENCIIRGNYVYSNTFKFGGYAAGVGLYQNGGVVRNCVFTGNKLNYYRVNYERNKGCILAAAACIASGEFVNNTVVSNTFTLSTDPGYASVPAAVGVTGSGAVVKNTLVKDNFETTTGAELASVATNWASFVNCCVTNAAALSGSGNVEATAGCFAKIGDVYALTLNSPCRNAGLDADWMMAACDAYGNARIIDGRVDIGAHEFDPTPQTSWSASRYEVYTSFEEEVSAGPVTGDTTGLRYFWDLDGDGVYEYEGRTARLAFPQAGTVVVTLRLENANGAFSTSARTFTVHGFSPRYVVKGNADAEYPYETPATAAATIEAALATAPDGTVVYIAAETYKPTVTLMLTNAVWLVGLTSNRADVVVDAQHQRRVVRIKNADAGLAYLTLKRGSTGSDSSPGVYNGGGTIDNCRVTQCKWIEYGGSPTAPRGAIHNAGVVRNTLVDNNYGGGAYRSDNQPESSGVYQCGGLMEKCVIRDNYVSDNKFKFGGYAAGVGLYLNGGVVRNCVFTGNKLNYYNVKNKGSIMAAAACVASGEFVNNTVISNTFTLSTDPGYASVPAAVGVTGSGAVVRNTLVKDNFETTTGAELASVATNGASFVCCCVTNAANFAGSGNVEATAGCYRIKPNGEVVVGRRSPAYEAGENQEWMAISTDLYGRARLRGPKVDIGAAESSADGLLLIVK